MNRKWIKLLIIGAVVLVVGIVIAVVLRLTSPEANAPECSEEYISQYGGGDCEAVLDIEE